MARFAFEARDSSGRVVRGTREAESEGALASALRERQLSVSRIRPAPGSSAVAPASASAAAAVAGAPAGPPPGPPGSALSPTLAVPAPSSPGEAKAVAQKEWGLRASSLELSLYFRQAQAMLHAGSSTSHAMAVASKHGSSPPLRRASEAMSLSTASGTPWSEAMSRYPGLFSELSLGIIAAGEASGKLEEACRKLSEYSERDYHLEQSVKRETWYPKLLVACSFLIPSVVPLVLGGVGAWWASVRLPLLVGVGVWAAWKGLRWASPLKSQSRALTLGLDRVKWALPVAGKVSRGLAAAKFCRALGASVGAGVPVGAAVSLSGRACGNAILQGAAERAKLQVLEGESLAGALGATGALPPVAVQMLATGEATGQTEEQLEKVATFLEGDAETAVKQSVKLLSVLALLIVGAVIGAQVVSFYTGMYAGAGALVDAGDGGGF